MKSLILVLAAILVTNLAEAQRPRPSGRTNSQPVRQPGRPGKDSVSIPEVKADPLPNADLANAREKLTALLAGYPETKIPSAKFDILAQAYSRLDADDVSIDYIRAVGRALAAEKTGKSIFTIENIAKTYHHFNDPVTNEELGGKALEVLNDIIDGYAAEMGDSHGEAGEYPLRVGTNKILQKYIPEEANLISFVKGLEKNKNLFTLGNAVPAKVGIGARLNNGAMGSRGNL